MKLVCYFKKMKTDALFLIHLLGNWYLVSGIWYLVFGIWYFVPGIWYLVFCTWYFVPGILYMVFGIWCEMSPASNILLRRALLSAFFLYFIHNCFHSYS